MAQHSNLFDRLFPRNTSKSDKLHLFQWAAYASNVNGVCYKREWMFSSFLEELSFRQIEDVSVMEAQLCFDKQHHKSGVVGSCI